MTPIKKLLCFLLAVTLILSLTISGATAGIGTGIVTTSSLRLREAPSSSSATLAYVSQGTEVEILEDAVDGWYKVSCAGVVGYMSADYLSVTLTPSESETPDEDNSTESEDTTAIGTGVVTTDSLRLREAPSSSSATLAYVSQGTEVEILEDAVGGWYKVSFAGVVGYMSADYLSVTFFSASDTPSTEEDTPTVEDVPTEEENTEDNSTASTFVGIGVVTSASLSLYAEPSTSSTILADFIQGVTVDILEVTADGWYKISFAGFVGYMSGESLSVTLFDGSNVPDETPGDGGTDSGEGTPPTTEDDATSLAEQLIRIGIYYGTAGKDTIDLSLTTGSGYYFGYYDTTNNNHFVILDSTTTKNITVSTKSNTMVVTSSSSGAELYRHDTTYGTQLGILPYSDSGDKTLTKCGYNYYGGFRFERMANYDNTMTIVNMVPLDDYIQGVVPYEMSASWPLEALKVQTVCARTFALSHLGKHWKFSFDLCDSDDCQVYKGYYAKSDAASIREAVSSTSGMALMYDGSYCSTVYSSSNGGASEAAKNVWGKDVPYLQGIYDPYEALIADRISKYNWTFTFTGEELQAKLIAAGYTNCGVIKEVKTTLSDTGNVIILTFVDANDKSYSLHNGSKCRTFLSLRSMRYTVSSENGSEISDGSVLANESESLDLNQGIAVMGADGTISYITEGYILTAEGTEKISTTPSNQAEGTTFTFSGTGWGHNVGMSQYGSYAMAELGYTFDQILQFYYTGAEVIQLDAEPTSLT